MFDSIGFQELALIALVALLVVGPKDLPLLARKMGRWTKKMRGMAMDFRASFDDLARQAELDELRKEVESLRNLQPLKEVEETLNERVDLAGPADKPQAAAPIGAKVPSGPNPPPDPLLSEPLSSEPTYFGDPVTTPIAAPAKKPRAPRKPKAETASTIVSEATPKTPRATNRAAKPKVAKTAKPASLMGDA